MKHILEPCEEAFVLYMKEAWKKEDGSYPSRAVAIRVMLGAYSIDEDSYGYQEHWDAFKAGWQANDESRAPKKKAKKGEDKP